MSTFKNAQQQKDLLRLIKLREKLYKEVQSFPAEDIDFFNSIFNEKHKDYKKNKAKVVLWDNMQQGKATKAEIKEALKLEKQIKNFDYKYRKVKHYGIVGVFIHGVTIKGLDFDEFAKLLATGEDLSEQELEKEMNFVYRNLNKKGIVN